MKTNTHNKDTRAHGSSSRDLARYYWLVVIYRFRVYITLYKCDVIVCYSNISFSSLFWLIWQNFTAVFPGLRAQDPLGLFLEGIHAFDGLGVEGLMIFHN